MRLTSADFAWPLCVVFCHQKSITPHDPVSASHAVMPVRAVHHAGAVRSRATARWCRVKAVLRSPPSPILRLPIPLLLPCEVLLQVAEYLPPESVVALVCCCKYMAGLYCEDGTRPTEHLWNALLARTFPARHTGAPGPNVLISDI